MKKILLTIFGVLFLYNIAFAALSSAMVWEVRTTGNANNGGAFKAGATGTDFSQQDAAEDSGTDLACADGDLASPVITSATHNFTSVDVGNIINITAGTGWTAGRYEIVSVNANAATLDRACGTDGAKTNGTWYLGGAVDHPNTISAVVVAGNKIYIAGGTYTYVGSNNYVISISVAGGNSSLIRWIGYKSGTARTIPYGTDRPLIDANGKTSGITLTDLNSIENLRVTRASKGVNNIRSARIINVSSYSNSAEGFYVDNTAPRVFIACDAYSNGGRGFSFESNYSGSFDFVYFCYSHDNTSQGLYGRGIVVTNCIFESNSSHGCYITGACTVLSCVSYNNTGTTGFTFEANYGISTVYNCIAMNNGTYGFSSGGTVISFDNNAYYGNSTAGLNGLSAGLGDVTTDPLFTAPTANPPDFTLQSASPCKDAGFPDANWAANVGLASGRY